VKDKIPCVAEADATETNCPACVLNLPAKRSKTNDFLTSYLEEGFEGRYDERYERQYGFWHPVILEKIYNSSILEIDAMLLSSRSNRKH
jgi:hypothetical protein